MAPCTDASRFCCYCRIDKSSICQVSLDKGRCKKHSSIAIKTRGRFFCLGTTHPVLQCVVRGVFYTKSSAQKEHKFLNVYHEFNKTDSFSWVVSRIGPVDKGKNSAETRRGIGRIVNMEIKKMAFAILLRFRAMAARMPLFRIFEMQCSRFKAEKLPSAQILRSRIMDRYSGVPTR